MKARRKDLEEEEKQKRSQRRGAREALGRTKSRGERPVGREGVERDRKHPSGSATENIRERYKRRRRGPDA